MWWLWRLQHIVHIIVIFIKSFSEPWWPMEASTFMFLCQFVQFLRLHKTVLESFSHITSTLLLKLQTHFVSRGVTDLERRLPGRQGKLDQFIWALRIYADETIVWFVVSQKDANREITKQWISYLKSSNSLKAFIWGHQSFLNSALQGIMTLYKEVMDDVVLKCLFILTILENPCTHALMHFLLIRITKTFCGGYSL